MTLHFRNACEKDIPQIHSLLKQVNLIHHNGRPDLFKIANKYTDEELSDILRDKNRPIYAAADENDVLVGYAFCIVKQFTDDCMMTDVKTLYIDDLCVDEKFRGRQVGKRLYNFVRETAKNNNFYNITLNVWTCNESARLFYDACGLKPQKTCMEEIL